MTPAAATIQHWRENPVAFVYDNFKVEPDAWQKKVLEAFADPTKHRISMQACAGPGKSAVEAWCGWNFLGCYGEVGEHPKGAAVSITKENLRDNLWAEFAKWQERSEYLKAAFEWQKQQLTGSGRRRHALPRRPNAARFQHCGDWHS
jgi:phage terminase large subunit